jgi:hypothetical protein
MFEEKINKIIESVELQNRPSGESNKPGRDTDLVKISFEELQILAGIFADILPEEVKSFTDAFSGNLIDFNNPALTISEKNEKEAEIIQLFERNKNSIAYLNSLNRILIAKEYDRTLLEELNRSYNFPAPQDQDYSSRDHYFGKLAETYVLGSNSGSIQYLAKTKNDSFLESLDFIEDVKTAITITERERLKKKMQFLDETEIPDLPEIEIRAAVTLAERERMKEIMRKLDAEEENEAIEISEADGFPGFKNNIPSPKIIPIEKNKSAWIKYAVAACIIGLIAVTTVIIYNNRNASNEIARNKPTTSDTSSTIKKNQGKIEALSINKWDSAEMTLTVRKESSMGFAVKQEKMAVRVYKPKENVAGLPEVEKQIDSLRKLNKTYIFKNNSLSVYLTNNDLPVLYKIDNKYYLKITDTVYHIRPSDKPAMLNKVTDRSILTRIDKTNYQQDNK